MFHMQVFTLPLTWKNLLFMKVEPQHTIVAQRNTYTWFSYFCYAYWQRRHTNTYKFQPCFFNPNFQFILYFSERTTYFQLLEWICILNEEQARAKKINMNCSTNTCRSFAGCAPDTIESINFKDCQHRIHVSIDSDQREGQCVFWRCQRAQLKNTICQSIGQMKKSSICATKKHNFDETKYNWRYRLIPLLSYRRFSSFESQLLWWIEMHVHREIKSKSNFILGWIFLNSKKNI